MSALQQSGQSLPTTLNHNLPGYIFLPIPSADIYVCCKCCSYNTKNLALVETITIREHRLKCLLVARIFAMASGTRIWSGSIIDQIRETYLCRSLLLSVHGRYIATHLMFIIRTLTGAKCPRSSKNSA
jgi:hypothetical protein